MFRVSWLLALLVLMGCSATVEFLELDYQFVDNPDEHRIELTFVNEFGFPVCLPPELWPNSAGKIDQASQIMALEIGGERFPVVDFNTGYCLDGCARVVAPGESVSAFIRYEDFGLAEEQIHQQKTLDFSPVTFRCRSSRR
jgi:hypothetical protein